MNVPAKMFVSTKPQIFVDLVCVEMWMNERKLMGTWGAAFVTVISCCVECSCRALSRSVPNWYIIGNICHLKASYTESLL